MPTTLTARYSSLIDRGVAHLATERASKEVGYINKEKGGYSTLKMNRPLTPTVTKGGI